MDFSKSLWGVIGAVQMVFFLYLCKDMNCVVVFSASLMGAAAAHGRKVNPPLTFVGSGFELPERSAASKLLFGLREGGLLTPPAMNALQETALVNPNPNWL